MLHVSQGKSSAVRGDQKGAASVFHELSAPRHATSDGLLLPRVPSPFRLRVDPGGRAGARCHQLHAGGWRSRWEDQHDSELHLQWIPDRVPADGLWRLLRWVMVDFYLFWRYFGILKAYKNS